MNNPAKVALRKQIKQLLKQTASENRIRQSNLITQKVFNFHGTINQVFSE